MDVDAPATYDDLVALLSQAIGQRLVYFASHPRVQGYAVQFVSKLDERLRLDHRSFFFLGFAEDNLVHEGLFLVGPTILGRHLVNLLRALDSGGILFRLGLTTEELLELFKIATLLKGEELSLQQAQNILLQRNVRHIQLSPPYRDPGWMGQFLYERHESAGVAGGVEGQPNHMVSVHRSMFGAVEEAHQLAGEDRELDVDAVRTIGEQLIKAAEGRFTDIMQLVRYPDYDTFTVGHSVRVASISVLVGQHLGMPAEVLVELAAAGLLHDVGKGKIPDEVLFKPTTLDDDERRTMQQHPVLGAQILLDNENAGPMAIAAAWGHHLRYDRGGYPALPKWGVSSRITALLKVCDVFEALTAVRPYKKAMAPRRAYELMLQDRGAFDPDAFAALVSAVGLYPPGSRVVLSNGERGNVLAAGRRPDAPVVSITHDPTGAKFQGEGVVRDLSVLGSTIQVERAETETDAREESLHSLHSPTLCTHPHDDPPSGPVTRFLDKGR